MKVRYFSCILTIGLLIGFNGSYANDIVRFSNKTDQVITVHDLVLYGDLTKCGEENNSACISDIDFELAEDETRDIEFQQPRDEQKKYEYSGAFGLNVIIGNSKSKPPIISLILPSSVYKSESYYELNILTTLEKKYDHFNSSSLQLANSRSSKLPKYGAIITQVKDYYFPERASQTQVTFVNLSK